MESWRLTVAERLGSLFSYFDHVVGLTGDVTTTARIGKWQEVTEFPESQKVYRTQDGMWAIDRNKKAVQFVLRTAVSFLYYKSNSL